MTLILEDVKSKWVPMGPHGGCYSGGSEDGESLSSMHTREGRMLVRTNLV